MNTQAYCSLKKPFYTKLDTKAELFLYRASHRFGQAKFPKGG